MIAKVSTSHIDGCVNAPASKSSMQRAVAAALLAKGSSTLINPSFSDDSISALQMAKCLGAEIQSYDDKIIIDGGFNPVCETLNCGESGFGVRMFSAIASLSEKEMRFTGEGSILSRPMDMIEKTLAGLGVVVTTTKGKLPFAVKGPLKGGKAYVDGSVSSQFLSGLLFALPLANEDSILEIDSLKSKPYIDLTLDVLQEFGITIQNQDYKTMVIPGKQKYIPTNYQVEGDWSGAAFIAVLGAISGKVTIGQLQMESSQADKRILDVLKLVGADVIENKNTITIQPNNLQAFTFDITDCPDLAPPLVALATFCRGKSVINGTDRLKVKESNRSYSLRKEFSSLGVNIQEFENRLEITGQESLKGGNVHSHGDHRIAMAMAVAATRSEGTVTIHGSESINKSYPGFFNDLVSLGGIVEINND